MQKARKCRIMKTNKITKYENKQTLSVAVSLNY